MPDSPAPETPSPAAQATPRTLDILGAADAAPTAALLARLDDAAQGAAIRCHTNLDSALASAAGAAPVLVPVELAETALADLMRAGHAPTAARDLWRGDARALRDQCRAHRRDVLLIAVSDLTGSPAAIRTLNERLGLSLPVAAQDAPRDQPPAPLRLLARMVLDQTETDRVLAAELEAMTLGAPPQKALMLVEAAFAERNTDRTALEELRSAQDADRTALADLEAERDLLRDSLAGVQEELAQLYDKARNDSQTLEAQIQLHKAAHEAAAHQLDRMRADQARREAVLGAESLEAQARETALLEELERVYSSRSWRVTGPLRRASGGLHKGS